MIETSVFTALADPTRRDLLLTLAADSPKTATQLADAYPITRQGILKHLDILEAAGLVSVHREGREKRYVLETEPLSEMEQWVQQLGTIWDQRLLRLKTLIENDDGSE